MGRDAIAVRILGRGCGAASGWLLILRTVTSTATGAVIGAAAVMVMVVSIKQIVLDGRDHRWLFAFAIGG